MDAGETVANSSLLARLVSVLTKPRGKVGQIRQVREQVEAKTDELWNYATLNHENTWFHKACKGDHLDE